MIAYDPGRWGLRFVWKLEGSTFPKAGCIALPNAILATALLFLWRDFEDAEDDEMKADMDGFLTMYAGYTSVIGFMVVFRNNQAYNRLWEGAGLLNQVRGEWFNCASNLISFCNKDPSKSAQVKHFQEVLVRLMSMLHCFALRRICELSPDFQLQIISDDGFDVNSLVFLTNVDNPVEVVIQWIQQTIVDADSDKTLNIAPPILSRAFQELSRGIVSLNNARKMKDVPFPFAYAQLITCMLMLHWVVTAFLASQLTRTWYWSALGSFVITFSLWSLTYIALEMDQPFGEDANDLPIKEAQRDFNSGLLVLLEPWAQTPPSYTARSISQGRLRLKLTGQNSASYLWRISQVEREKENERSLNSKDARREFRKYFSCKPVDGLEDLGKSAELAPVFAKPSKLEDERPSTQVLRHIGTDGAFFDNGLNEEPPDMRSQAEQTPAVDHAIPSSRLSEESILITGTASGSTPTASESGDEVSVASEGIFSRHSLQQGFSEVGGSSSSTVPANRASVTSSHRGLSASRVSRTSNQREPKVKPKSCLHRPSTLEALTLPPAQTTDSQDDSITRLDDNAPRRSFGSFAVRPQKRVSYNLRLSGQSEGNFVGKTSDGASDDYDYTTDILDATRRESINTNSSI